MQLLDGNGQDVGGVGERAVPIAAVGGEIVAHRLLGLGRERESGEVVEAADRGDRVSDEVPVADVVDARIVHQWVSQVGVEVGPRTLDRVLGVLSPVQRPGKALVDLPEGHDLGGEHLHRVAVYPDDAGVRVGIEERSQASAVKSLEHPPLRPTGVLDVLQHHAVQGVLRVMVLWKILDGHGHPPPGAGVRRAEVEGPRTFTLGQSRAEQIVVGVADDPRRDAVEDLPPVGVGLCPARVDGGRAGWRRGVHHLPEPQRSRILVLGEQGMQQRRPRPRLASGEERGRDLFCRKG